ncbi:MAG TPA: hypothetical protein VEZ47_05735 [Gemmatirosa sp.]|nr:hypothetical protein [Gemmatirosa sp.]
MSGQGSRAWGRWSARAPVVLLLAARAAAAEAQLPAARAPALRPELRLDGTFGAQGSALAGLGLATDAGRAVRLALTVGGGAARLGGGWQPAGGATLVGRFLLDPFRQARRGLYVGGGVGARVARRDAPRWLLLGVVGLEPPAGGRIVPAVELGLGGGVRAAVVLRRLPKDRR